MHAHRATVENDTDAVLTIELDTPLTDSVHLHVQANNELQEDNTRKLKLTV